MPAKNARRHENQPDETDCAGLFDAALADGRVILKWEVWFDGDYALVTARGYAPGNVKRKGVLYEETLKARSTSGQTVPWAAYHTGLRIYTKAVKDRDDEARKQGVDLT
jgi:hypothetical protein